MNSIVQIIHYTESAQRHYCSLLLVTMNTVDSKTLRMTILLYCTSSRLFYCVWLEESIYKYIICYTFDKMFQEKEKEAQNEKIKRYIEERKKGK